MNTQTATEYRNLPLSVLTESKTNPRRIFEDDALRELAESIRTSGVVQPLLVRPITEQDFEIVVGARRFRASKLAEKFDAPCRIANLTDAEVLEIQLVELSIVVKGFLSCIAVSHVVDMSTTCRFIV
jgi:ParB family chromosome partitioning protein